MAVKIAEYLGQRVDCDLVEIEYSAPNPKFAPTCPFMGGPCSKLKGKLSHHPVCSVRTDSEYFAVCPDRILPANTKFVTPQHISLLRQLSEVLFPTTQSRNIGYKRQQGIKLGPKRTVYLDYVLALSESRPDKITKVIVEIQGGGETSNTGTITRHIYDWADSDLKTNAQLRKSLSGVGLIPNNAWKRQLEQIIRKLPYAKKFGGSFCLAMGTVLYDYVLANAPGGTEYYNDWEIAFVEIAEEVENPRIGPVPLKVGRSRFISFDDFLLALSTHELSDELRNPFAGEYLTLTNEQFELI
jgi:hypothetical protein